MRYLSEQPPLTLAFAAFASLGLLVLVGVLAPSWARLSGFDLIQITSPKLLFPELLKQEPFDNYSVLIEQPLFNADRKKDPPPPPPLSLLAQLPSLDSYRLVGVIITADKSLALVERRATKNVVELKSGDMLDGRTVKDITPAGVVFGGSAMSEVLSIPKAPGAHIISPNPQTPGYDNSNIAKKSAEAGDRDTN